MCCKGYKRLEFPFLFIIIVKIHVSHRRFRGKWQDLTWVFKLWSNFYKMSWSSLRCWTTAVKNCKDLTTNWKSNIFSQLHLQAQFFISMGSLKVLEWEKYQHLVLGCKRIHKLGRTCSGFLWSFMELCRSKVQLAPPRGNLSNGFAKPEIEN